MSVSVLLFDLHPHHCLVCTGLELRKSGDGNKEVSAVSAFGSSVGDQQHSAPHLQKHMGAPFTPQNALILQPSSLASHSLSPLGLPFSKSGPQSSSLFGSHHPDRKLLFAA